MRLFFSMIVFAVLAAGCQPSPQQTTRIIPESDPNEVKAAILHFRQSHDFSRTQMSDATARLKAEGFDCEASNVDAGTKNGPYMGCIRTMRDGACMRSVVTLFPEWGTIAMDMSSLGRTTVRDYTFFCIPS